MKYLIVAVAVLTFVNFVHCECDEKGQKALKECYSKFDVVVDAKSSDALKQFCKILNEHQNCVKELSKSCRSQSPEEIGKIMGKSKEDAFKDLFLLHSYKYICDYKFEGSQEDLACIRNESALSAKACGQPNDCLELDKHNTCMKEALLKKCINEELANVQIEAIKYANKQLIPNCA
uniref:DUF19 domain-containing protein n=1 Tax=Panagrolaimus davidi TaxID=227884 RepID=A0A914P5G6_9BILA